MSELANLPAWYWALLGGILGGCTASFLGVVLERLPRGEGIGGRSRCACGRQLTAGENIPVLGWLRVGGRARCCGTRLPVSYLAGEILGVIVIGSLGWVAGWSGIASGVSIALIGAFALAFARWRRGPLHPADRNGP
jgi:prepilin signal peptidase PulO-like enzyme (type II secretory pathway)